jgi:hypothetical protein
MRPVRALFVGVLACADADGPKESASTTDTDTGTTRPALANVTALAVGSDYSVCLIDAGRLRCDPSFEDYDERFTDVATDGVYWWALRDDGVLQPVDFGFDADGLEGVFNDIAGSLYDIRCAKPLDGGWQCFDLVYNPVLLELANRELDHLAVGYGPQACWLTDGQLECADERDGELVAPEGAGTTYTEVDVGYDLGCAITTEGLPVCFGRYADDLDPGPATGAYVDVTCGNAHCCFLVDDGSVTCAGPPFYDIEVFEPAELRFERIDAHQFETCGVTEDHRVHCWFTTGGEYEMFDSD